MSIEENKALVRRYFAELNRGNFEAAEECLAPGFVRYNVAGTTIDRAGYCQFLRRVAKEIPDIHRTIDDMVAEGNKVVACFTWAGTDTGGFGGGPATGRRLAVPEVYIARIEGGKIADFRQSADRLGVYHQLGKSPPAPPAP